MNKLDYVFDRTGTSSVKWDFSKVKFGQEHLLPMWVADMDFQAPKPVIDAIQNRAEHGIFGYSSPTIQTRRIVTDWVEKEYHWNIPTSSIVFTSGIVNAISMAIQALTNKQDQIMIQTPVYYPFFEMIERNERQVIENPLQLVDNRYEINFDDLENKFKENNIKMFLLCHPQNPSGRAWSKDELNQVGELCVKYDVTIVSDEIHCDLMLYNKKHIPFASLNNDIADRTITCLAPSKTFNIAGLQSSAIIIENSVMRKKFEDTLKRHGLFTLNTFAITALEAAYQHGRPWLDELKEYLQSNIEFVKTELEKSLPSIKVMIPDASYLLWIDCREILSNESQLKELLLQKGKVALEMSGQYRGEPGFVRMNIGCPKELVKEGVQRLIFALS
ncbi:MalY/PatB family protein [Bacillus carboniphilus]|uniref:cysteine-S-conjugate beta-lyase n=1 Tax=Bacillus carboniphilus TaxID=86663 RepID=A0ABY9JS64_9BACI|nr:MalY/PatB family protein [Bacillus carboniphilus]WLR41250.1 MalY/PatB family protein [Bacillus carboniphilus]